MSEKSTIKRVLVAIAVVLAVAIWYLNDYFHADDVALAVVADEAGDADGVVVRELSDGSIAFIPDEPSTGLVFYPGAKVQPEAYAPLLEQCAEKGVLCIVIKPLFNLSLLSADAAEGAQQHFPEITSWIVAGHSMGGVAAAGYASRHADAVDAIAFLAAYPDADLSGFEGPCVSVVGSDDGVLNWDNYKKAAGKLPPSSKEEIIEGGNHAYFGNYGEQPGDGSAAISREEQQSQTAEELVGLAHAVKK